MLKKTVRVYSSSTYQSSDDKEGDLMRKWIGLACVFALTMMVGCGGGGQVLALFFYRFTHASPDMTPVDFYANEELMGVNKAYEEGTEYFTLGINEPFVEFYSTPTGDPSNQIDPIEVNPKKNVSVHVVLIGVLNKTGQQFGQRMVAVPINRTTPGGSNARITVLHGFNRAPQFVTPSVDLAKPGDDTPIIANIPYGLPDPELVGNYTGEIPTGGGPYTFAIRIAGEKDAVLYTFGPITFEANKSYLLILSGIEGSVTSPPTIIVIEEPIKN